MIRNIKAFGLAVFAVLALGAISASAASAVEFHSDAELTKYTATGDGNQVLVMPAGTITCTGVTWEATTTKKTNPTITAANIVYTGAGSNGKCITQTVFGPIEESVNFTTNECDYTFHAAGEVDLGCKTGTSGVIISGPGCTITFPSQAGLKSVTYDNIGTETNSKDVTMTARIKGISGTATGFACNSQGSFSTAEYTGNVTVKGFEDKAGGAQVGIWIE